MDTSDVLSLVEDLGSNIDDLEESLAPLLKTALSASTSKLPLLDKAKLYVLATYAIETILFSALRLNGVDAKAHPVFQELSRVKEYFGKIKSAETAGTKRSTAVDREAAGRFIKHGLAGNDRYDRERAERAAWEKAGAKRKLEDMQGVGTHTRFDGAAKRIRAVEEKDVVSSAHGSDDEPEPEPSQVSPAETQTLDKKAAKRQRRQEARLADEASSALSPAIAQGDTADAEDADEATSRAGSGKRSKKAPRSQNETFQALLQGPLRNTEEKGSRKKKRKSKGQVQQELENQRAEEMK